MIDTDMAEQILQGDDTHPDILQALGLELLAEVKLWKVRYEEANHHLDLMVGCHGIETLVELVESEEE